MHFWFLAPPPEPAVRAAPHFSDPKDWRCEPQRLARQKVTGWGARGTVFLIVFDYDNFILKVVSMMILISITPSLHDFEK